MPNFFDAATRDGWESLVRMASNFGWRDGAGLEKAMSRQSLVTAIRVNCTPMNVINRHQDELRRIYSASYFSGRRSTEKK